jgi:hypothetical protein
MILCSKTEGFLRLPYKIWDAAVRNFNLHDHIDNYFSTDLVSFLDLSYLGLRKRVQVKNLGTRSKPSIGSTKVWGFFGLLKVNPHNCFSFQPRHFFFSGQGFLISTGVIFEATGANFIAWATKFWLLYSFKALIIIFLTRSSL